MAHPADNRTAGNIFNGENIYECATQRFMPVGQFDRATFEGPEKSFRFQFVCSIVIPIRNDVNVGPLIFRINQATI
jgi:hypothetical protein